MIKIQKELVAPKDKNAGRYKYRSAEDLYEKIKPLLESELNITTALIDIVGRVFVEASVRYKNATSKGYAEIETNNKNMSAGQATGAATSYAIKYAICMLFLIDNGEDLDGQENLGGKQATAPEDTLKKEPELDIKRLLHSKMRAAGMPDSEMKAFFGTYCGNETMQGRVLENFDRFLSEWRTSDKVRVMK